MIEWLGAEACVSEAGPVSWCVLEVSRRNVLHPDAAVSRQLAPVSSQ